jgi:hypothetical protein
MRFSGRFLDVDFKKDCHVQSTRDDPHTQVRTGANISMPFNASEDWLIVALERWKHRVLMLFLLLATLLLSSALLLLEFRLVLEVWYRQPV